MGYEIVRNLNYNEKNNSYFVDSKSSNDSEGYKTWECEYIPEEIKNLKGYTEKQKMDLSIMEAYIKGDFQEGDTIFEEVLQKLLKDETFKKADWRNRDYQGAKEFRKKLGDEYYHLIAKYLFT